MKQIFILILSSMSLFSFAQKRIDSLFAAGDITFSLVDSIPFELTASFTQMDDKANVDLFARSKEWIVHTFNNANNIVQIDDRLSGLIMGKYEFETSEITIIDSKIQIEKLKASPAYKNMSDDEKAVRLKEYQSKTSSPLKMRYKITFKLNTKDRRFRIQCSDIMYKGDFIDNFQPLEEMMKRRNDMGQDSSDGIFDNLVLNIQNLMVSYDNYIKKSKVNDGL